MEKNEHKTKAPRSFKTTKTPACSPAIKPSVAIIEPPPIKLEEVYVPEYTTKIVMIDNKPVLVQSEK
ncbi:MAG: hypothetical protein Solumvirus2_15 [Solumvirus sp.]|uniref:Uncharacterized protein n=1 Tax=Solumvirus sp. TaxID=2487773 RepID=A0A3G5AGE9_9VIRU|nr:MAG: hypothetical protein Solumvirus2_15 [Solumvirus sp.]